MAVQKESKEKKTEPGRIGTNEDQCEKEPQTKREGEGGKKRKEDFRGEK